MSIPRARAFPRSVLLALVAVLAAGAAPPAAADGPEGDPPLSGRWEIRGALKDAGDAVAAGNLDQAGELYRQVVASIAAGDDRRAEALYGVALVEALTPPAERDAARAAAALEELASSYPGFERGPEVAAARSCLAELDRAGGDSQRLTSRVAELEAELAERTARLAAEDAAAGDRVAELEAESEALRAQVEQLRRKLSTVEAELKKKEEALDKVKQTLVGG